MKSNHEKILKSAQDLRWDIGADFHEKTMEALYTDATRITDRAVTYPDEKPRFDLDRTIDKLVTSRVWGFPLMILMQHSLMVRKLVDMKLQGTGRLNANTRYQVTLLSLGQTQ